MLLAERDVENYNIPFASIDELPTIYFRGLDNLIATARSNKISTRLGLQDLSQLKRDYSDKEAAPNQYFNAVRRINSGK